MSSPIHNGDKLEALQLYAPPWLREQPASTTVGPQVPVPQADSQPAAAPSSDALSVASPSAELSVDETPSAAGSPGDGGKPTETEPYSAAQLWPAKTSAPSMTPEAQLARGAQRAAPEMSGVVGSDKPQPRMPAGVGGPNLDWRPHRSVRQQPATRSQRSEGLSTAQALRQRLSLDPEAVPEPPIPVRQRSLMPLLGRVGLMIVFAVTVAYAITFYSIPDSRPVTVRADNGIPDPNTVGAGDEASAEVPSAKIPTMRLVIEGRRVFANEPVPLGVSLIGAPSSEVAILSGLISGTKLSVGTALSDTSWRLAARDLPSALAYAPKDYVGVMNAAIDLRASNDSILDRNVMRLEWVGKPPDVRPVTPRVERPASAQPGLPVQTIDNEELDILLKRGAEYMKAGDIAAARLVLGRAASSGNPEAALAFGATFDPIVFRELGVVGSGADAAQARFWYEQAGKRGAREAAQRIDRLTKLAR